MLKPLSPQLSFLFCGYVTHGSQWIYMMYLSIFFNNMIALVPVK